jgi:hypothetical protein
MRFRKQSFNTISKTISSKRPSEEAIMHSGKRNHPQLASILTIAVAALLLFTASASAQSFRGSIRGTVTDPSGSVIAGAKITANNINTGLQRETTTGLDGAYVLAELPAGEYTVRAESAGLSPTAQNVQVNVGVDTAANFDLTQVERHQEQLTVTGEAPVIETTRDVLGEVVEHKLVVDLPLNGRDFGKLVALTPGVTVDPSGVAGTQGGFGQFNINGNRDRSNNYSLDGTENNDPFFNNSALNQVGITGAPATLLPIDAIQEFNLQSQFRAEYGRNSGSVVNIVTRSGTNQFHGSVFEFLRNSALDARNVFNTEPRKTSLRNNNFGAAIGGPVVKNKTFFFGAYEGQREAVGSDFVLGVPTDKQIGDAQTLALSSAQITTVNPALLNILSTFYPASTSGTVASVVNDTNNLDNLIVKVDHNLTNNELITGRYAFGHSNQSFPLGSQGGFGKGSRLPEFAQTSPARVQVVSLSWLSTLSATRINEVRFGYSRYRTSFSSVDLNQKFDPASLAQPYSHSTWELENSASPNSTSAGTSKTSAHKDSVCHAAEPVEPIRSSTISHGCMANTPSSSAQNSVGQQSITSTTISNAEFCHLGRIILHFHYACSPIRLRIAAMQFLHRSPISSSATLSPPSLPATRSERPTTRGSRSLDKTICVSLPNSR